MGSSAKCSKCGLSRSSLCANYAAKMVKGGGGGEAVPENTASEVGRENTGRYFSSKQ